MSGKSILVIEDNPVTRRMMRVALERGGFEVREARSGEEALALARARVPDLVLQDLVMPGTDSAALLRSLRGLPGGDVLPVLVCSGSLSRVDEMRSLDQGFSGFLYKPVDPGKLLQVVHSHLEPGLEAP